jgi:hypothetical protein
MTPEPPPLNLEGGTLPTALLLFCTEPCSTIGEFPLGYPRVGFLSISGVVQRTLFRKQKKTAIVTFEFAHSSKLEISELPVGVAEKYDWRLEQINF